MADLPFEAVGGLVIYRLVSVWYVRWFFHTNVYSRDLVVLSYSWVPLPATAHISRSHFTLPILERLLAGFQRRRVGVEMCLGFLRIAYSPNQLQVCIFWEMSCLVRGVDNGLF